MVNFYKGILNKTYIYILINSVVWREICSVDDNFLVRLRTDYFYFSLFPLKTNTSLWLISSHNSVLCMRFHPYSLPQAPVTSVLLLIACWCVRWCCVPFDLNSTCLLSFLFGLLFGCFFKYDFDLLVLELYLGYINSSAHIFSRRPVDFIYFYLLSDLFPVSFAIWKDCRVLYTVWHVEHEVRTSVLHPPFQSSTVISFSMYALHQTNQCPYKMWPMHDLRDEPFKSKSSFYLPVWVQNCPGSEGTGPP